jgi:gamma-glutamylputrescine oxidase
MTSLRDTDRDLARDCWYERSAGRGPATTAFDGDSRCDVAVVGGGLAGLSAALEIARQGRSVRLLEADRFGSGASGRNGGQALHGLACDMPVIESQLGLDDARRVYGMTVEAVELMRRRMAEHAIDCDWQAGYLAVATSARKGAALAAWAQRMNMVYGDPLRTIAPAEMGAWIASPRYHSAVHDARSGHLHPLKYTLGLARAAAQAGAVMHEHSAVVALQPGAPGGDVMLRTPRGTLRASQVLLAGNVHLQGLAPALAARIMPVGTYIACTAPLPPGLAARLIPSRSAVCDTNFVLDYFRPTADDRMLYGGRVSYSTVTPAHLAQAMRQRLVGTFPQLADAPIEHAWGGLVDITMNRAPDFGRLDAATGDRAARIYYLQGFSGHGLALTGLAGQLAAQAMAGDAGRFDLFSRLKHRPFPGGRWLRTPALVLGMAWYRLRDALG